MAKRKRSKNDEGVIDMLLVLPWQVSVATAAVVFVLMRWVFPAQANSPMMIPLANMISGLAPIAALFLLVIGGISYFKNSCSQSTQRTVNQPESGYQPAANASNTDFSLFTPLTPTKVITPTEWSLELLRELEWNRFEILCAEYFRILGKRVETISYGADGGIDARIYANNSDVLEYAIQCKAWSGMVGVATVRELFGVMAHESAGKGIFMATSTFSEDAKLFAKDHSDKLFLIDGEKFILMILKLPVEKQQNLLGLATEGDYTTPTCASCGVKMVRRTGKRGEFWGCKNYPRCSSMLRIGAAT